MAVKLTPLSRGLIAVIIIGGATAVVWNLGLKDMLMGDEQAVEQADGEALAEGRGDGKAVSATQATGPLGSKGNPLKVSIVSFHGYAPAMVANGNSLTTKPGSLFDAQGVQVELVIQDDIPTLTTIFESKAAHCAWRTSDFWAQEQPNLRNTKLDARAIMIVDNTQGADAVIARDPSVRSVEDLAGKSVALLQYTPSHGMLIDAVESSSLSARKKASVNYVFINVDEGTAGVRAAFASKQVDAAALWDPDLSLALRAVPGAHVIYSTKTATNLIYDVIVCDSRVLDSPANQKAFQGFVSGWLEGVTAAERDPDNAVEALVQTQEFFKLLAKEQGKGFVKELFANLDWTGLDDNIRILGLAGGTNHYARVYKRFDGIYRAAGALANTASPVIEPGQSFDLRFIQALMAQKPAAAIEAKKPQFEFSAQEGKQAAEKEAAVTKPVSVNFDTGAFVLTKRAARTIDLEMVPLIENNGSAYFEVSGNTDATGSRPANLKLSERRAEAVVSYLIEQWEFPRERFVVVGNGPDKPIESNDTPEGREKNRRTDIKVYPNPAGQ